ncbi:hypothetical protein GKG03_08610 [Finegoldia sp. BIOML-A3]|uniref:hypothetical protein n=1 Tax=unclassified Finegoldia TaxID=2619637 RepID=UPI0012B0C577|nr:MULTISPECIES: hypothetical protein [unclassified Finegoldia]MSA99725.1 hypothetical protein [Finegoldia sp. BIOML-A3]MSB93711.1 hypothetical protein [Finegoldia sp. BIOML-A4]
MLDKKEENSLKSKLLLWWGYVKDNKIKSSFKLILFIIPFALMHPYCLEIFNKHIGISIASLIVLFTINEFFEIKELIEINTNEKKYREKEKKYKEEINKLTDIAVNLGDILESVPDDFLRVVSKYMELKNSDRISLYVMKKDDFKIIGRYSENPLYIEKSGREYGNKGYIFKCVGNRNGKPYFHRQELPDSETNINGYIRVVNKETGMSKKSIKSLNMKSRCYFTRIITGTGMENVGVLVIETMNSRFNIEAEEINFKLEELVIPHLITILEISNKLKEDESYEN